MFYELQRKRQELSFDECITILTNEKRGVLSINDPNGYPYGIPMNHFYNEEDGKIYFHCGTKGHKIDALRNDNKVSFCTYDQGYRKENEWALNIRSVVVFGTMKIVDDINKVIDITEKLSHKFTDDDAYISSEISENAHRTLLLVLTPQHICGKEVNEA